VETGEMIRQIILGWIDKMQIACTQSVLRPPPSCKASIFCRVCNAFGDFGDFEKARTKEVLEELSM
jgi:hypothetical protein